MGSPWLDLDQFATLVRMLQVAHPQQSPELPVVSKQCGIFSRYDPDEDMHCPTAIPIYTSASTVEYEADLPETPWIEQSGNNFIAYISSGRVNRAVTVAETLGNHRSN